MKIAVLVSGGVDSSVALALLQKQGHDVSAFYLRIWLEDDVAYLGDCPWQEDLTYVENVCKQLKVPLKIIDLQQAYWDRVVQYALDEVKLGRTPNPDMMCNARVKFSAFFDAIDDSYEKIATGHYADTQVIDGLTYLKRVPDQIKDQTYFLAHLNQKQISRAMFPIGKMTKKEVRKVAHELNLPTKDRKDSQGICFLGKISYANFLKHYFSEKEGDIINEVNGAKLGTHKGYWFYTIGQRKGISSGLGDGPWYVTKKDIKKNIVYVSNSAHVFEKNTIIATHAHWIAKPPTFDSTHPLKLKIRHGQQLHTIKNIEQKDQAFHITMNEVDKSIASGQFIVFYDQYFCFGCARIL